MTFKGGLIAVIAVSVLMYLADWGFYMGLYPMPAEVTDAMGAHMYTEANMPNIGWWFLFEVCVAGLLAFACLQTTLSLSQAAQRGALVLAMIVVAFDVIWGMTISVSVPLPYIFTELAYKIALGAISGVAMVMVSKRFS